MIKLKIVANIAAAALLGSGLVYYNFIDKPAKSGVQVGNLCPDFTAETYRVEGDIFTLDGEPFTLSQKIGTVCVLNFWETWCPGCIKELPHFNEVQEVYGDKIEIIGFIGNTSTREDATEWLNKQGWETLAPDSDWRTFSMQFGYLPMDMSNTLGCVGGKLPRTVIIDKSGLVAHETNTEMSYEDLVAQIDALL